MKNKNIITTVIIAVIVVIGFVGYGLVTKESKDNNFEEKSPIQEFSVPSLSIGASSDIKNTLQLMSNSYLDNNSEIEIQVSEQENLPLVEGLLNGDYDIIVITDEIKNINLDVDETLYSEILFGTLVNSDQEFPNNLTYCYVLNENIGSPEVNDFLQYFYSQPLAFVNNEEVYALQPNIYEESLDYIKIFSSSEQ